MSDFLGSYLKIRKFIPKEALEQPENLEAIEMEKEQWKRLPEIVEELQKHLSVLDNFTDNL